jgi:hypothetical protein
MAQFSSFSDYYMFLSGTFLSSNVPESSHQPQIEVVSGVDLLYACIPSLNSAIAPSPGCEVLSSSL